MKLNNNPEYPHSQFPVRLEHMEGKDQMDKKVCFFQSQEHLQKYLNSAKLTTNQYQAYYRDNDLQTPDRSKNSQVGRRKRGNDKRAL
jgi:hypothetical protein